MLFSAGAWRSSMIQSVGELGRRAQSTSEYSSGLEVMSELELRNFLLLVLLVSLRCSSPLLTGQILEELALKKHAASSTARTGQTSELSRRTSIVCLVTEAR